MALTEQQAFEQYVKAGGYADKRGAFSDGWEDAIARRGDYRRMKQPSVKAYGAYLAGKHWAHKRKWKSAA